MLLAPAAFLAQTHPAGVVTVLSGPRTLFLDEYADPVQPKIRTTIYFTDFTEISWSFSLRLKISGPNGILLQTRAGARPAVPFNIAPGQPYEISGADLAFFFNYDNLTFTGISRAQLETNNRLPEGLYSFCFEAVDYESGTPLSLPGCATAWLALADPPLVISPVCGSVIENISVQNILFQWQLANANGNLNVQQLSYKIRLYEVNNAWSNPVTAIMNNQAVPVFESDELSQNTYIYSLADPPLEKGKRYVFTVQAIQANGRCSFKNNGYSTPCWMRFGYQENDTIDVLKPVDGFQFTLSTASQFRWKKPRHASPTQLVTYTLKLVEVDSLQTAASAMLMNSPFYQQTYLSSSLAETEKTIPVTFWGNIRRNGHYAWQVSAQSGTQLIARSEIATFIGPPEIENFIAGGFLMKVTSLTYYNKSTHVISGRCKTTLCPSWGAETEFAFSNITITAIGSNEYVMSSGSIADHINGGQYTLTPATIPRNQQAWFKADSVLVNTSGLRLSGSVDWLLPHAGTAFQQERLTSARCRLSLANSTFYLNSSTGIHLTQAYAVPLLEPSGFILYISQSSNLAVSQSHYEFAFNGLVELPAGVQNESGGHTRLAYANAAQLFYLYEANDPDCEGIRFSSSGKLHFVPTRYTIDLSERQSPAEFAADTAWKGVHIERGHLDIATQPDPSNQLNLPFARSFTFTNTVSDTNRAYVNQHGFTFNGSFPFTRADSIKFNTFVSSSGLFFAKVEQDNLERAGLHGQMLVPVIDTANGFHYVLPMTDFGFQQGYLTDALAGYSFTFNPAGSVEQRIAATINRAVFRSGNHLEMEMNLTWPFLSATLSGVNEFCVWGNGNIGFGVPNGQTSLTYPAAGVLQGYSITTEAVGCGRSGNAYGFGVSARVILGEDVSGETGPPLVNAYSIYRNPLLTGMVVIPSTVSLASGTNAVVSATYASSTAGYTNALGSGIGDALGALGLAPGDTARQLTGLPGQTVALVTNNVITQLQRIADVISRLRPFINEDAISSREWQVLDRFRMALQSDAARQSQVTNARQLLNFVCGKVVESMLRRMEAPVRNLSNQAIAKLRTGINSLVVQPINQHTEQSIDYVFQKIKARVLPLVDEEQRETVANTFSIVQSAIAAGIKNSVANSFEENITSHVASFVEVGVTAKVTGFIRKEVVYAGDQLLSQGISANINLSDVIRDAGTVLAGIADTVRDVFLQMNSTTLLHTAESLVDDAVAGIDWNAVSAQIAAGLISAGISEATSNILSQAVQNKASSIAASILAMVRFDFSNLGEKLQNGQLDKVVKFDPTNIYIISPAVDIQGHVVFMRDDAVYGDCWKGDVTVYVKTPNKDNPLVCIGEFLSGKTSPAAGDYHYWYAKLGVRGLNVEIKPTPITWDGVDGHAFSRMKKTGTTLVPENINKFGVGCKFYFYDKETSGETILFDLGLDVAFNSGGFSAEMVGDASVLNFIKSSGRFVAPGLITGVGTLGYYTSPGCKKIAGDFDVTLNTDPLLCAGGELGFELKTPSDWKVFFGTATSPMGIKVLCKDFLANTGYVVVNQSGFSGGVNMSVNIAARSPWVQLSGIKLRGSAALSFGYAAALNMSWHPTFHINDASVNAWANASLNIDYETAAGANSLTLAAVSLSGNLTYKSNPEAELHGNMSGNITVLSYSIAFSTPVHYSLSKQGIID